MSRRFFQFLFKSNLSCKFLIKNRQFHLSTSFYKKSFTRPQERYQNFNKQEENLESDSDPEISKDMLDDPVDQEYKKMLERSFRVSNMGHNVFVIQPFIKWGHGKKRITTPELQLAESCALIRTLNSWSIADQTTISLMSFEKTSFFGKGNIEKLQDRVFQNSEISAVFISVDILKGVQREYLENLFKVPVFDRYSIVIQIFREHATSREAKLQVRLAEFPYLRGRLKKTYSGGQFSGSSGETYTEFLRNILKEKEKRVRAEINLLRNQREILRKNRKKSQLPIVAVVGYTNSGKTSLIKALTEEDQIMPKDVLFATLDVTVHAGLLPSGMKALYIDTVGFISNIPTNLIESFVATLEDALLADVIVHVRDISHPDATAQVAHVQETLNRLNLKPDLLGNIIEVGNKADLVKSLNESEWDGVLLTSAVKLKGLEEVKHAIEDGILRATGRQKMDIRVKSGGDEYQWLMREATVSNVRGDDRDAQFCIMSVIISPSVLAKFKHQFIMSARRRV